MSRWLQTMVPVAVALVICAVFAWAAGSHGVQRAGIPVAWWVAALAVLIQWLAFVPAWLARTEHFYDLTGSATFITVSVGTLFLVDAYELPRLLLAATVLVWALRLGSFLFLRIRRAGEDKRFRAIKQSAGRFFFVWTLQGTWVVVTSSAAVAALGQSAAPTLSPVFLLGIALWIAGFSIEVIADRQKSAFRSDPANKERFIKHGLWAWSRHPNYFGEILLWLGIAIAASPSLVGWQWLTLLSPALVAFLLLRVSGVPTLEKQAQVRWGDNPEFEAYMRDTPMLLPRPPRA